jgi:hypothetical protein
MSKTHSNLGFLQYPGTHGYTILYYIFQFTLSPHAHPPHMSSHTVYPHTQDVLTHGMSSHTVYPHTQDVLTHRMSSYTGCPHTQYILTHSVLTYSKYILTHSISSHTFHPHTCLHIHLLAHAPLAHHMQQNLQHSLGGGRGKGVPKLALLELL